VIQTFSGGGPDKWQHCALIALAVWAHNAKYPPFEAYSKIRIFCTVVKIVDSQDIKKPKFSIQNNRILQGRKTFVEAKGFRNKWRARRDLNPQPSA
jgi:hypothetical protein